MRVVTVGRRVEEGMDPKYRGRPGREAHSACARFP
jgi:hypothetical protein